MDKNTKAGAWTGNAKPKNAGWSSIVEGHINLVKHFEILS
jgi:hypothetical protein